MKSFVIAFFFIASAVAAEEFFCTPNSLFQKSCNSCVCSKDGKSAACTDMACPDQQMQRFCEPGKQFHMDDLSTCVCNENGMTAACTLGLQAYGRSRYLTKNSQYCTPGSTFSPDNCNTCVCSQDGVNAMCTLQMCAVEQPKQVCEASKSFKNYCNTCFCNEEGSSYACTRMYCDKDIWNRDGSMKVVIKKSAGVERVCEPRKNFKNYCNHCVCSADGTTFACTRMFCDKNIWNEDGTSKIAVKSAEARVCSPNTHFKEQCNTCTCSADGLTKFCTMMACDNFDSLTKKQTCIPKATFSLDDCNTCKCNDFGTDYVCTFKMC